MTKKTHPIAKKWIYDLSPYVAGEGAPGAIKLASNENPLGPSPVAIKALHDNAHDQHLYPDSACDELRQELAHFYGFHKDMMMCGAGSDEIIRLLFMAYCGVGDNIVTHAHAFLMYKVGAQSVGCDAVMVPEKNITIDVDGLIAAIDENTKMVMVANPNNPTGTWVSRGEIERLIAGVPKDVLIVLDAAYCEFMDDADYHAGHEWAISHDNVIVLRTFSKIYGLAGLRVGWCHAHPEIIDVLNRTKGVFNVTRITQKAAIAALYDQDHVKKTKDHNKATLQTVFHALDKMGVGYQPSSCNFFLMDCETAERSKIINDYMKAHKIYLRPVRAYGLPTYLRVSVGTSDEMKVFLDILEKGLKNGFEKE